MADQLRLAAGPEAVRRLSLRSALSVTDAMAAIKQDKKFACIAHLQSHCSNVSWCLLDGFNEPRGQAWLPACM